MNGMMKGISILAVTLMIHLYGALSQCAEVRLSWNAVAEAEGYTVYYGSESGSYSQYQDAENQTSNILTLTPGIYYFAVTAYGEERESDHSDEISCRIAGTADAACVRNKLKATIKLCKSYARCYRKGIRSAVLNIDDLVLKAEEKFYSVWNRVETKTATKGLDCSTVQQTAIRDIIYLGYEDLYNRISSGLDLESQDAINLAQAIFKIAGDRCCNFINAEGADIKAHNAVKFERARSKAQEKFIKGWNKAMTQAESIGVVYSGPSIGDVSDITDSMVLDVVSGMGY